MRPNGRISDPPQHGPLTPPPRYAGGSAPARRPPVTDIFKLEKTLTFVFCVDRADIARYLYMYQYGGFYFCQPINEKSLSHLCILEIEAEDMPELGGGPKLGNALIGSAPVWPCGRSLLIAFSRVFARARSSRTVRRDEEPATLAAGSSHLMTGYRVQMYVAVADPNTFETRTTKVCLPAPRP